MVLMSNPRSGRRAGFTLLELLVVIGIIAILMTLMAGAYFKVVEGQNESNTGTLVQKIGRTIDQQWQAALDEANQEDLSLKTPVQNMAQDKNGRNKRRERVIWIQQRLK